MLCSLLILSVIRSDIGIGGLGLHPLRLRATMVFVSLCMSFTCKPVSPVDFFWS